jgi:branched-chain amino acid aminotransferase
MTPALVLPDAAPFPQPSLAPLDSSKLVLQLNPNPHKPNFEGLVWGQNFAAHMLCVTWKQGQGWGIPTIQPYGPLAISPAAPVLQYASSCFEGMKAYRCKDGHVRLFRPEMNMARMNRSATRASLPGFDGIEMIKLLKRLIQANFDYVPHLLGESLYLRPTLIGTPDSLSMGTPTEAMLYCICNPVGSYFGVGAGIEPVSLLAVSKNIRAWPGGTGNYKLGANYVGATLVASQAQMQGHEQILWLFGEDPELTEVGAMNLFVVMKSGSKSELKRKHSGEI